MWSEAPEEKILIDIEDIFSSIKDDWKELEWHLEKIRRYEDKASSPETFELDYIKELLSFIRTGLDDLERHLGNIRRSEEKVLLYLAGVGKLLEEEIEYE